MITHTTAKKLKEFLGGSLPIPIDGIWWSWLPKTEMTCIHYLGEKHGELDYPAYQLHDLLSKLFTEALNKAWTKSNQGEPIGTAHSVASRLFNAYYAGGMEAVEKCLCEIMGK